MLRTISEECGGVAPGRTWGRLVLDAEGRKGGDWDLVERPSTTGLGGLGTSQLSSRHWELTRALIRNHPSQFVIQSDLRWWSGRQGQTGTAPTGSIRLMLWGDLWPEIYYIWYLPIRQQGSSEGRINHKRLFIEIKTVGVLQWQLTRSQPWNSPQECWDRDYSLNMS